MENRESRGQIEREARRRLYPSLSDPNWLVLRKRRRILQSWLSRLPARNLRILDVGGRIQPYRPLLEGRMGCYYALDTQTTEFVNIVGRGEQMPFAGGEFDFVICTQVLEYVPDPPQLIAEIYRVLKPSGQLFLSVPGVFPRDNEFDSWRFLPPGLRILLAGFNDLETIPEGSSISGLFRSISVCLVLFARPTPLRGLLRFTVVPIFNVVAAVMEWLLPNFNDCFTANYSVWARK
jgi:SAM-dependent methyltransferase